MRLRTTAHLLVVIVVLAFVGASSAQGAAEPGVVHFTAAGDYAASSATSAVLERTRTQAPDLNLALGDLSYGATGAEQAWCDFVTSRVGAGFPFELLSGNHESNGQNGNINDFSACLPNQLPGLVGTYGRQWYVDVPRVDPLVRFVMISPAIPFPQGTYSYAPGTPEYDWTARAIDGARTASIPWVVVGMHVPCWSLGQYACSVDPGLRAMLFSKRVDLVLNGHEHLYQRTRQLTQGTAACPTVPVDAFDADCVADPDDDMAAGAGTVFATVGTGGQGLRPVNTADPEAGYFAASSGSNLAPTHGLLDVRATAGELTARFVGVDGAFTDSFVIRRGAAPPNRAPTASFTSAVQGLSATVDGSGSSDPDGTIASHTWDFGDGSTAGGPTAGHTYAAPGTYTVTLTVTDDDGATATTTRPVTVEQPPAGPVDFVTDTFNRTVTGGLGTADRGGAWSTSGTTANFSVAPSGAALRLTTPGGSTLSGWLGGTTRSDTDLRLTLALDKVATGNGVYVDVVGRRVSLNNEYRARLVFSATGRITVQLTALRGTSSAVGLAPAITLPTSVTYAAGSQLQVRLQVTGTAGTTVRLKVWPAGQPEPAAWQTTATDTTAALQAPGAVGIGAYLSSSATNAPVTVRVSGLSARPTA
jgi:PKD repeat protein